MLSPGILALHEHPDRVIVPITRARVEQTFVPE